VTNSFASRAAILLSAVLITTGCSASKQTAFVTERADNTERVTVTERPESTEGVGVDPEPNRPARTKAAAAAVEVDAGRFPGGKLWTFEDPPKDLLKEEYDFAPDSAWWKRARLGALRFTDGASLCSASFVSPSGLILTNHHCARRTVASLSRDGEELLDGGYSASTSSLERAAADVEVAQLIAMEDVTRRVYYRDPDEDNPKRVSEADARQRAESLEERLDAEAKLRDSTLTVEIVELYNGGKFSAYTYKQYDDVRLVFAPQLQVGHFGGDPDNFTYPRYSLDFAFFRAYDTEGRPVESDSFFEWNLTGVREGDPVFVVGTPGGTSRLLTVSQLEFERDYVLPAELNVLKTRAGILADYIDRHPVDSGGWDVRDDLLSLQNTIKLYTHQLAGLNSGDVIARRAAVESALKASIAESDSLSGLYGDLFSELESLQWTKRAVIAQSSAFTFFAARPDAASRILFRALYGWLIDVYRQRGAPPDLVSDLREGASKIKDAPPEVEKAFIAARLGELEKRLGRNDPTMRSILGDRDPVDVATELVDSTAIADSAGFASIMKTGYLSSGDITVEFISALAPLYFSLGQQLQIFEDEEEELNARLALARFAIQGTSVPPDATGSLRISDGVVKGYEYNGTRAPAFTTFFGMYERHSASGGHEAWALPASWTAPPEGLELSTPLNFAMTNDTSGGSSGAPVLDKNLRIVGVSFDGNIESTVNDFVYSDVAARSIAVDARAILHVLDDVYGTDRLVLELTTGVLYETEEEADAVETAD
jgi:hypothetical protein